jgi:Resolvase, N terminal domain
VNETEFQNHPLVLEVINGSRRMRYDKLAALVNADGNTIYDYVRSERSRLLGLEKERLRQERKEERKKRWDFPISPSGLCGYLRLSSPEQLKGGGFWRQRKVVTEYCEREGFVVQDIVFIEDVGSAFWGQYLKRKFGRFLEWAKQGKLGTNAHMFMEADDRFSRLESGETLSLIKSLLESGVTLHFIWDHVILSPDFWARCENEVATGDRGGALSMMMHSLRKIGFN